MGLIDLYVNEVGKRLPLRGRGDIEAELRSTLQDMLEDRSRKVGREVDEAMTLDLLREYGAPDKVANTYNPHQFLIGPRLYPFFLMVLKIVLSVLTIVLLVTLGIQLSTQTLSGLDLAKAIGSGLLGVLQAAVQAFGNVVLVFAILERFVPGSDFSMDEDKKDWDPASLLKAAEPEAVKPWEPITAIVFTAAAMIVFNGYPDLLGAYFLKDGSWTSIPALTEAFWRWMPTINILWSLNIALNVVLMRQGRWQAATKWASIALSLAGIFIGYMLLAGPPIVGLTPEALLTTGVFDARGAAAVSTAAQQGARAVILIVIIVQAVGVVKDVVRQVLRRR